MTKARLETFSDGVIAIIITIMVLELDVPQDPQSRRAHTARSRVPELRTQFYISGHLLEQPSPPAPCVPTREWRRPLGQSALIVLVVISPLCHGLDGREPVCSMDACPLWSCPNVCCYRLLHPDAYSPFAPREGFSPRDSAW